MKPILTCLAALVMLAGFATARATEAEAKKVDTEEPPAKADKKKEDAKAEKSEATVAPAVGTLEDVFFVRMIDLSSLDRPAEAAEPDAEALKVVWREVE